MRWRPSPGGTIWGLFRTRPTGEIPPTWATLQLPPKLAVTLSRGSAVSLSPDGFRVVYSAGTGGRSQLYLRPLEGARKPRPFLQTRFSEGSAAISTNGRWIAYESNESGQFEIYVQPFPGGGPKSQISTEGGFAPLWSQAGDELFYMNNGKVLAVAVTAQPDFQAAKAKVLFEGNYQGEFDVTADGRRFVRVRGNDQGSAPTRLNLVLNWFAELERRAPARERPAK